MYMYHCLSVSCILAHLQVHRDSHPEKWHKQRGRDTGARRCRHLEPLSAEPWEEAVRCTAVITNSRLLYLHFLFIHVFNELLLMAHVNWKGLNCAFNTLSFLWANYKELLIADCSEPNCSLPWTGVSPVIMIMIISYRQERRTKFKDNGRTAPYPASNSSRLGSTQSSKMPSPAQIDGFPHSLNLLFTMFQILSRLTIDKPRHEHNLIVHQQTIELRRCEIHKYTHILLHIYTRKYYSVFKKWNNAICSNMDGPRDDHTKWRKSDKHHMISFICGIQNTTQMNPSMKQKQTHRHREQICGCQGEAGVVGDGLRVWH